MKLEPTNIICPKCGNANYMRHLVGENVGKLDMKCINCNSYFNFNELYNQKIAEVIKPKTNADRIRTMTNEELANIWCTYVDCGECPNHIKCSMTYQDCLRFALEWLEQECET